MSTHHITHYAIQYMQWLDEERRKNTHTLTLAATTADCSAFSVTVSAAMRSRAHCRIAALRPASDDDMRAACACAKRKLHKSC